VSARPVQNFNKSALLKSGVSMHINRFFFICWTKMCMHICGARGVPQGEAINPFAMGGLKTLSYYIFDVYSDL
jgi:hypothetical protein